MKKLELLEKIIGINFENKKLLLNAFVHRSYLNENKKFYLPSNEKLEFLGDSVLSLVTSIYLYQKFPELHEGEYTNIKAKIVKTESLFEAGIELKINEYLLLSKGEEENKGRLSKSIIADCFEALIGSIFLDKGFNTAYGFISRFLFKDKLDYIVKNNLYQSPKNRLQEYFQEIHKKLPEYKVLKQSGPEHNKIYQVGVFFEKKLIADGVGNSKKAAEEAAAVLALKNLKI